MSKQHEIVNLFLSSDGKKSGKSITNITHKNTKISTCFTLVKRSQTNNKIYFTELDVDLGLFSYISDNVPISLDKLQSKLHGRSIFEVLEQYSYSQQKSYKIKFNAFVYNYRVPVKYFVNIKDTNNIYCFDNIYLVNDINSELITDTSNSTYFNKKPTNPFYSKNNPKYDEQMFVTYSVKITNKKFMLCQYNGPRCLFTTKEKNFKAKKMSKLWNDVFCCVDENNTITDTTNIIYKIYDIDKNDSLINKESNEELNNIDTCETNSECSDCASYPSYNSDEELINY